MLFRSSNFLEAIYYLETFRSFRGARDEQLVGFDNELFRVTGTMQATDEECGTEVVTAAFERNGKRKKVSVNGDEPERLGDDSQSATAASQLTSKWTSTRASAHASRDCLSVGHCSSGNSDMAGPGHAV